MLGLTASFQHHQHPPRDSHRQVGTAIGTVDHHGSYDMTCQRHIYLAGGTDRQGYYLKRDKQNTYFILSQMEGRQRMGIL